MQFLAGCLLLAALALPFEVTTSILLSHVLLAGIVLLWLLSEVQPHRQNKSPGARAMMRLTAVVLVCMLVQNWLLETPYRFVEEAPKYVLLFLGAMSIALALDKLLWRLMPLAALALTANVIYAWRTQADVFTYGGRLQLDGLGSPNSLALMIAFAILVLLFAQGDYLARALVVLARWPAIGLLTFILFQTESRGGLLSLVIGVAAALLLGLPRSGGRRLGRLVSSLVGVIGAASAAIAFVSATGYLDQYTARLDLTATGADSGRTEIWRLLLSDLANSNVGLFIGFGPGSIQIAFLGKVVESAHSMVMAMFYSFGLIGLISFLVVIVVIWRTALRTRDPHAPLRFGLLACLTFSFFVDNVALSTQALAPSAFALAAVIAHSDAFRRNEKKSPAPASPSAASLRPQMGLRSTKR